MMSLSPSFIDQHPSYSCSVRTSAMSPPAGHSGDNAVSHLQPPDVRFFFCPPGVEPLYAGPLRRSGPGLLPCIVPFHPHARFYECPLEPAFIQKRNERERQRVKCVNQGYAKLRDHLPGHSGDKRLSKVETLRAAIRYIKYLQGLVEPGGGRSESGARNGAMES